MILSSSTEASSLGIEDTPVSLLAKTLSDPATDDVKVALLSENTRQTQLSETIKKVNIQINPFNPKSMYTDADIRVQ